MNFKPINYTILGLLPGDILLYGDGSVLSRLIQMRTWSDVSHVEVYIGGNQSVASRSEGVNLYPLRVDGLRRVFRPVLFTDMEAAMKWFSMVQGTKYGWLDLWRFYGIDVPTKEMICSEFADAFFTAGRNPLFNQEYPDGAVCPRDYEITPLLTEVWNWKSKQTLSLPGTVCETAQQDASTAVPAPTPTSAPVPGV